VIFTVVFIEKREKIIKISNRSSIEYVTYYFRLWNL